MPHKEDRITIQDALRFGAERLSLRPDIAADARRDAQALLEMATHHSRVYMRTHPEHALSNEAGARYDALLKARLQAVPIQHLRGSQEFYGRNFHVTPDVLIPRPETEILIDQALLRADRNRPIHIADVGTGSGILAITLALELPSAEVWAFDISAPALPVAQANADRLGAASRIHFVESDLLGAAGGRTFDLIVSNPPYVPLRDRDTLHAQVRDFEPALALFGGGDGLDVFRRLIPQVWQHLRPGGWLLMETGGDVAPIHKMLAGWSHLRTCNDLQAIPRVVAAQRP